jgi:hypothetical protein
LSPEDRKESTHAVRPISRKPFSGHTSVFEGLKKVRERGSGETAVCSPGFKADLKNRKARGVWQDPRRQEAVQLSDSSAKNPLLIP